MKKRADSLQPGDVINPYPYGGHLPQWFTVSDTHIDPFTKDIVIRCDRERAVPGVFHRRPGELIDVQENEKEGS